MANVVLSHADLKAITGFSQAPKQIEELEASGIPHGIRSDGKPYVMSQDLKNHINGIQGSGVSATPTEPNFDALQV